MNRSIVILTSNRDINIVKSNFKKIIDEHSVIFYDKKCDSIPQSINNVIKQIKENDPDIEFIHIFHDDLIINDNFNIDKYESFMKEFDLGYYFNPRLSPLNYIFDLLSPRFIIETKKYSDSNINLFPFDAREYTIINCKKNNELFIEDAPTLYNIEYIYRCKNLGNIPFLNFYFDNSSFNNDMMRDNINFPRKQISSYNYMNEEKILHEKYKINWIPDSNADDVVNYFKKIKGL